MKNVVSIKRSNDAQWVGDGFPVRNIFSYDVIAQDISPFSYWTTADRPASNPPETSAGRANIPIGDSRQLRSFTTMRSNIGTRPAEAVSSAPVTCSG